DEVRSGLLEPLEDRLRELLDRFENLVELRLSARYDEQALLSEIVAENARVRRLRGTPGSELALGELVASAYEHKRRQDARELLGRLETLVADEAPAEGRDWDLLTTSFLVRRVHVAALENAVE